MACSHESIVQGCPVWTANDCRRQGYDTWSPEQDSIAGETALKTSTRQNDQGEVTGPIATWSTLSDESMGFKASLNVDSTSQHFITSCAMFSQPEDSSTTPLGFTEFSLRVDAQVTAPSDSTSYKATNTRLVPNGASDVYLHAHTLSRIFTFAQGPRTRVQLPRYIQQHSTPPRLLSQTVPLSQTETYTMDE